MNIDPGSAILLALGCVFLCVIGYVFLSIFQFLGGIIGFLGSIFGAFFHILSGGPVSWCGCLVVLILLFGCGVLALLILQSLSTCGGAQATNFCSLFGR